MAQRTVTDALGRCLRVPQLPQRLLSLVPSLTEALFAFGYGPQVVAVTDYCTEPAAQVAAKPRIGGTKNPDVARILALQPDLVLAVAEENRRQDVEQLAAAGIPVYVFEPRTVRDGIDVLWRLAELLGCRARVASQIEEIEAVYAETLALVAQRPRVRVFCPIWKNPYMTINEETYVHDVLRVCGGDNVFARRQRRFPLAADLGQAPEATGARYAGRDRRYPRVTLAEMAALRPDVILLPDEPYVFTEADMADFLPFSEVPAVRHGRIYLVDGKLLSWYGPRIGHSLRTLRALLAP
ncbi:MAG: ABC transporter substrate-binding protein [Candidatus Tectimicrobiota bacterium]|nr:MAG: ABC transporter substrate-binding protein [Candidatus Tectomicrobia bacterium]